MHESMFSTSLILFLYPTVFPKLSQNLKVPWKVTQMLEFKELKPYRMTPSQTSSWNCIEYLLRALESESVCHSVVSDSLRHHGLYSPWNSPGQNTGVGSLFPSPEDLPNPGI